MTMKTTPTTPTYLLTRDAFCTAVFVRDNTRCVVPDCGRAAVDAHHILERRLWADGGYYLENGVSVCEKHHLEAEQTLISCADLRTWAGITITVLPDHLYSDTVYDKWGNEILPNEMRLRGELFLDESVQKALAPVLHLFTDRVKYPRTFHLPWSPGVGKDDRVVQDLEMFEGKEVVVTVKLDGENTTMYRDYVHARSLEFAPHPSRDRVKALHGQIAYNIPYGWRVCGENLYAKHSIHYEHLSAWFTAFSIWDDRNVCLAWEDTLLWAELLGVKTVPVLYRGLWDEGLIKKLYTPTHNGDVCEGYVVRVVDEFPYRAFRRSVAKYVRANHVVTHGGHWANRVVVPNKLDVESE